MVGYLLDGQQRVSTLVGTLRLADETGAIVDQIDWRVYYDLDSQEFVHRQQLGPAGPQYFPIRSLLNTAGFFEACRRRVWLFCIDDFSPILRTFSPRLSPVRGRFRENGAKPPPPTRLFG